jgi:hypothetical protein
MRPQFRHLPLQPVEHRRSVRQRGLLAGFRAPAASHGRCAGFLGPMPWALRQRSERSRARSRRSSGVNLGLGM